MEAAENKMPSPSGPLPVAPAAAPPAVCSSIPAQPDAAAARAPEHEAHARTARDVSAGAGEGSAFERNSIRVLAGGFALFIVLTVIKAASLGDVRSWKIASIVAIVMFVAVLLRIAMKGYTEAEEEAQESSPRFYELADPTRPLTDEDVPQDLGDRSDALGTGV